MSVLLHGCVNQADVNGFITLGSTKHTDSWLVKQRKCCLYGGMEWVPWVMFPQSQGFQLTESVFCSGGKIAICFLSGNLFSSPSTFHEGTLLMNRHVEHSAHPSQTITQILRQMWLDCAPFSIPIGLYKKRKATHVTFTDDVSLKVSFVYFS